MMLKGRPEPNSMSGENVQSLKNFGAKPLPMAYPSEYACISLVGGLGTVIGVTENWAENSEGGCVVEDGAEGNGGGLDWWEVWRGKLAKYRVELFSPTGMKTQ